MPSVGAPPPQPLARTAEPALAGGPDVGGATDKSAERAVLEARADASGLDADGLAQADADAAPVLVEAAPPVRPHLHDEDRSDPGRAKDPLQTLNRGSFEVDQAIRQAVVGRGGGVVHRVPRPVKAGFASAVENLSEPTSVANNILQRRVGRAARGALRFLINSTVGMFGLVDAASSLGLKSTHTDFDRTLASYHVGPGAYVYEPIKGPTSVRGVIGAVVDSFISPVHWLQLSLPERGAVSVATTVRWSNVKTAPDAKVDRYAAIRDAYLQRLAASDGRGRVELAGGPRKVSAGPAHSKAAVELAGAAPRRGDGELASQDRPPPGRLAGEPDRPRFAVTGGL